MTIPEITKLLEAEKFGEAETALYELLKADRQNTSVACLLGSLYEHYSNPARSRENAKKYFSSAATGIPPVEEAFVGLARLEGHSNRAIRIIEKGLSVFPKSQPLLLQLFRHNALENREAVFLQAESQGVASDDMRAEMVSGFVALRQFEKALKLLDTIKKQSLLETRDLMTAVCLLELKQIEKAKEIFRRIVADDIDHKFIYVPNFGLIASFVELQSRSAFELLSEIPIEVAWSSTEFAYWPFYFDYSSFVLRVIGTLEKLPTCKNFLPKLRGLRGLLVNASPELFTAVRNRARMVKDLEYARRHMPQNALICKALHDDRVQNGNHFEACKLAVSYFGCAGDPKADDYGLDLDYLGTLTIEKFTEIVEDFKGLLPSERYGLSRDGGIFDAVVQRLHKDNKYSAVAELAEIAGDYYSEKTGREHGNAGCQQRDAKESWKSFA